jgi:uncharacterized protein (DUF305 family)
MNFRTIALAASVLAAALVLAGCNTTTGMDSMDSTPDPSSSAAFNNADATFAMEMIPHHQQAIEMAEILLDKEGVDERVVDLALQIKEAQGPEIETMTEWLEAWGFGTGMGGMDHGDGMMSDDDMAALESAGGPEASTLFLEQMTQHHEGAIEMAQQELVEGENSDALDLAQRIVDDQTAEIAVMRDLLAEL